jgi:hypothetical protein
LLRDGTNIRTTRLFEILRDTKHILLLLSTKEDIEPWKKGTNLEELVSKRYSSIIKPYIQSSKEIVLIHTLNL